MSSVCPSGLVFTMHLTDWVHCLFLSPPVPLTACFSHCLFLSHGPFLSLSVSHFLILSLYHPHPTSSVTQDRSTEGRHYVVPPGCSEHINGTSSISTESVAHAAASDGPLLYSTGRILPCSVVAIFSVTPRLVTHTISSTCNALSSC